MRDRAMDCEAGMVAQYEQMTPCAAGSSSTPITDENLIQQPAPPPVAVPFSLPCQ